MSTSAITSGGSAASKADRAPSSGAWKIFSNLTTLAINCAQVLTDEHKVDVNEGGVDGSIRTPVNSPIRFYWDAIYNSWSYPQIFLETITTNASLMFSNDAFLDRVAVPVLRDVLLCRIKKNPDIEQYFTTEFLRGKIHESLAMVFKEPMRVTLSMTAQGESRYMESDPAPSFEHLGGPPTQPKVEHLPDAPCIRINPQWLNALLMEKDEDYEAIDHHLALGTIKFMHEVFHHLTPFFLDLEWKIQLLLRDRKTPAQRKASKLKRLTKTPSDIGTQPGIKPQSKNKKLSTEGDMGNRAEHYLVFGPEIGASMEKTWIFHMKEEPSMPFADVLFLYIGQTLETAVTFRIPPEYSTKFLSGHSFAPMAAKNSWSDLNLITHVKELTSPGSNAQMFVHRATKLKCERLKRPISKELSEDAHYEELAEAQGLVPADFAQAAHAAAAAASASSSVETPLHPQNLLQAFSQSSILQTPLREAGSAARSARGPTPSPSPSPIPLEWTDVHDDQGEPLESTVSPFNGHARSEPPSIVSYHVRAARAQSGINYSKLIATVPEIRKLFMEQSQEEEEE